MEKQLYLSQKTKREDIECVILAKLGFSYEAIAKRTGLTTSQVSYRLKLAGVSPVQYRRGETELAGRVMALASTESRQYFDTMVSEIKKYLKD